MHSGLLYLNNVGEAGEAVLRVVFLSRWCLFPDYGIGSGKETTEY